MQKFHKSSKFFLYLVISALSFSVSSCDAQVSNDAKGGDVIVENDPDGIQWISFEQAVALSEKKKKKLFIDVYTNWCGWCKKMDATTFKEDEVVKFINTNFYAVKLNAETKDTIRFRDREFKYVAEYKANELAISLLSGKMGYPSYVLLDEQFTLMTPPVQSYLVKDDLMPILLFYGNNLYKNQTWEEYKAKK